MKIAMKLVSLLPNYNGHEEDIKVAEEAGLGLNMFVLLVGGTYYVFVSVFFDPSDI